MKSELEQGLDKVEAILCTFSNVVELSEKVRVLRN